MTIFLFAPLVSAVTVVCQASLICYTEELGDDKLLYLVSFYSWRMTSNFLHLAPFSPLFPPSTLTLSFHPSCTPVPLAGPALVSVIDAAIFASHLLVLYSLLPSSPWPFLSCWQFWLFFIHQILLNVLTLFWDQRRRLDDCPEGWTFLTSHFIIILQWGFNIRMYLQGTALCGTV